MSTTQAWGVGIATVAADGTTLDTYFRHLGFGEAVPAGTQTESQTHTDPRRGVSLVPTSLVIDTTAAPTSASDVYLRLHLLSHRLAKPRTVNLDGAFGLLANVAWTSIGPVALDALEDVRYNQLKQGVQLVVNGVDKFPRMTDYVVPSGVRIADASRVRLGAHLASGRPNFCRRSCWRWFRHWRRRIHHGHAVWWRKRNGDRWREVLAWCKQRSWHFAR